MLLDWYISDQMLYVWFHFFSHAFFFNLTDHYKIAHHAKVLNIPILRMLVMLPYNYNDDEVPLIMIP